MVVTKNPAGNYAIKSWETRGWEPKDPRLIRQLETKGFLIHAGLQWKQYQKDLIKEWPFADYFEDIKPLKFGAIVGHVTMGKVLSTEGWKELHSTYETERPQEEYRFGDYSDGRFAFELKDAIKFTNQHRVSGLRKFWDLDIKMCMKCGCTDDNCIACIQKTGQPCHWISPNLCSACA